METILKEVLKRTKPTKAEREKVESFASSVVKKLEKTGHKASIEGSLAKDTWVSGNHDLDVFLFFDTSVPRPKLEAEGLKIGKCVIRELGGKPEIAYAEHPYVKATLKNFNLDVVPCYSIKKATDLQSAVDRTPFHTAYIKKSLTTGQKGQVRALKQFMKGIGVYSAKEKVRGFSGYLCELLVTHYGDFQTVARAAKSWKFGTVIDIEKFYKSKKASLEKFSHSLVVIDPIDENRNVAAALDNDNFENFVFACSEFLKKPTIEFFFPNPVKSLAVDELKQTLAKHGRIFLVKFKTPNLVEDILYSQLRRSLSSLIRATEAEDFQIVDSSFYSGKHSYLLLEFEYVKLPKIKKLTGPPISVDSKYQEKFQQKYKGREPWVEKGRWYVEVPRKHTDALSLFTHLLSNPRKIGVGKYVSESITKDYKLIDGTCIGLEYRGEFAQFLTQYLVKKKPWKW